MEKTYFIQTFGCAQNVADSERISAHFEAQGYTPTDSWKRADVVVINTCMVRQMAEDRVYGLVKNIREIREIGEIREFKGSTKRPRIIVTGCMVGVARADKTGKIMERMRERMPGVEFMETAEILSNTNKYYPILTNTNKIEGKREKGKDKKEGSDKIAYVIISNGCNNFCTYCVVPFARGREVSRAWEEIIEECRKLRKRGVKSVMLLGQNVNSWGTDLILSNTNQYYPTQPSLKATAGTVLTNTNKLKNKKLGKTETQKSKRDAEVIDSNVTMKQCNNEVMKPVMVKHLGRYRIPTLFPPLLEAVASLGFENVNFMSSNPWDFSNELIDVIARNKNISRTIHLPVQSGDDRVLKRMNRWYTAEEYTKLVEKLRRKVSGHPEPRRGGAKGPINDVSGRSGGPSASTAARLQDDNNVRLTTDIMVGFPGETEEQFQNTVKLCKKVSFEKAYISLYSPRPLTAATLNFPDDVPHAIKKKRWEVLEKLINKKVH